MTNMVYPDSRTGAKIGVALLFQWHALSSWVLGHRQIPGVP